MQRTQRRGAAISTLVALLVLGTSPVHSEPSADQLVNLMESSGLTEQLVQFEATMLAQLQEGMGGEFSSETPDTRMKDAVQSAYSARKLQQRVRHHLEGSLSDQEIASVLEWLATPLGERVTRLEKEASTPEAYVDQSEIAEFLAENLAAERLERYRRLDQAVQVSELTYSISVNSIVAVAEGLSLVAPGVESSPSDQLRARIEAERERITESLRAATIQSFAYTYRALEDADLDRYIEFAESPLGRKYHSAVSAAFERALSEAGRDFGLALGSSATS